MDILDLHKCVRMSGTRLLSEFYIPTFRNTLFHLHKQVGVKSDSSYLPAYEDRTVFRNVGI